MEMLIIDDDAGMCDMLEDYIIKYNSEQKSPADINIKKFVSVPFMFTYLEMIKESRVYKEHFCPTFTLSGNNAEVIVEENTTFAAAKKYIGDGKIAVLNFANPHNPGGGVVNGAVAQEECLCRSSNLYSALVTDEARKDYYNYNILKKSNIFTDRIIYSPNVTVFKSDDDIPILMDESEWFDVARYNNVEVLILGAFGCGAFGNSPELVARAFHEISDRYKEYFKKIIFAIKSTKSGDGQICPNISEFEKEFSENLNGNNIPYDSIDAVTKKKIIKTKIDMLAMFAVAFVIVLIILLSVL